MLSETLLEEITICPFHNAIAFKIFEKISEATDKLFYMASGNSLGLLKYGGQLPWDDDIDVGFASSCSNFSDFFDFVKKVLRENTDFFVMVNMTVDGNEVFQKLGYDISFEEFEKTKLQSVNFVNFSIDLEKLQSLHKLEPTAQKYIWKTGQPVIPWVDVFPFQNLKNNNLISHNPLTPSLTAPFIPRQIFNRLTIKMPVDLSFKVFQNYSSCCDNDKIFCHIKDKTHTIPQSHFNETSKFVREYNKRLAHLIEKLECCF